MMASAAAAEQRPEPTRRRRVGANIAFSGGGGGILIIGGSLIAAAAAAAFFALRRSGTNGRNPPPPPIDGGDKRGLQSLVPPSNQKDEILVQEIDKTHSLEMIAELVVEGSDETGKEENPPLISSQQLETEPLAPPLIMKKEILGNDNSVVEINQTPSLEPELVFEEKMTEVIGKQENPLLSFQEMETESEITEVQESKEEIFMGENPLPSSQDEITQSSDSDDELEDDSEEVSDGIGSSSVESTAEAVWPSEVIEQYYKADSGILKKPNKVMDTDQDEEEDEEYLHESFLIGSSAIESMTMKGVEMEFDIIETRLIELNFIKTHLRGFLMIVALMLVLWLIWLADSRLQLPDHMQHHRLV